MADAVKLARNRLKAVELHKEGLSIRGVAAKMKVSHETARAWLIAHGAVSGPEGTWELNDGLLRVEAGLSISASARQVGCSRAQLSLFVSSMRTAKTRRRDRQLAKVT